MSTSISATEIGLPDNAKIKLGTGNDLQIVHNSINTQFTNTTGNLEFITTNTAQFLSSGNVLAKFIPSGASELYHNGSKKFETTSAGVTVSGASDGVLNLDTTDSRGAFVRFGQGGSFHNMVGCADGLTSGDKEDLGVRAADNIIFASGGSTERMRIHSSGVVQISSEKLCIGTSATNAGVSDGMLVTEFNGSTKNGFKSRANPGASESQHIIFIQNSSEVGRIHTNNSSTSYATSSDYRLKENVTAISDGINRLKTLKPSRFNFIIDPDKTVDGFLAHEVTAVPEAISGTKDEVDSDNNPKYQTIDQSKLVPLLVAAVQELAAKVEALEAA